MRKMGAQLPCFEGIETGEDAVRSWCENAWMTFGTLTCGTPDDVADRIEEMLDQSGGFGTFLLLAHNAADWQATQKSYELFSRYVMPRFQNRDRRSQSLQWISDNRGQLFGSVMQATEQAIEKHKERMA
jgi:limonene 1,2-monooxygenase